MAFPCFGQKQQKNSWIVFQLEEEVVSKWFLTFQVSASLLLDGVFALSDGLGLVLTMSHRGQWFFCGCLRHSLFSEEESHVPVFLA